MDDADVLALETRRRIYHAIRDRPGLHLRGIAREVGIPLSTVRHHLRYLSEHELVAGDEDGRYVRYFPTRTLSPADKAHLKVLRREKPRRILLELLARGEEVGYGSLLDDLGYPASTLGLYLKELVDRGLVAREPAGRTSTYRLVDGQRLHRLLLEYEESFYDRWVDRVLEIVEEGWASEDADHHPHEP